ncbi:HAMP domain-containing histidine kinase [Candidatus Saccharibacteria bacterium]|nr:HAMP domain-containing histidine kinase [Candidatus Saccharibacteria bacterium]
MEGFKQQRVTGGAQAMSVPLFITAAHELKSPLALIRQLSLSLEAGECSSAEQQDLARKITLTTERALRMTADLTRTSRLEDSLFSLEPLNPVTLCEEVAEELAPLYHAKGKQITVSKRLRPPLALANKDLLRRILLNFADNALQYSTTDAPVVVSAHTVAGQVRVGVRDYGPALPAGVWKTLESSLGTRAQPLHARPESSGLGIYIANQFAQAMNARVGATRHQNGVTFYVEVSPSTQLRLL